MLSPDQNGDSSTVWFGDWNLLTFLGFENGLGTRTLKFSETGEVEFNEIDFLAVWYGIVNQLSLDFAQAILGTEFY